MGNDLSLTHCHYTLSRSIRNVNPSGSIGLISVEPGNKTKEC